MSSASLEDKNLYYAKRLAEMIKCKTISNKENIDETKMNITTKYQLVQTDTK